MNKTDIPSFCNCKTPSIEFVPIKKAGGVIPFHRENVYLFCRCCWKAALLA